MKENYLLTFLKGMLMGIADVIPGVSGGTIAFITGIYDRLINGIKNIGDFIAGFFKKIIGQNKEKYSSLFKRIDFLFFIPLVLGIGLSFLIGSQVMSDLMEKYPAQVYSFFIGLIIASAVLVFRKIKVHDFSEIVFCALGFLLGLGISFIPVATSQDTPSLVFLFFLGAIAICAMILPGISGAYIVLMFGQLKFMYDSIGNFTVMWPYLLAFALGAVIGLLLFSRLLSYLLVKHHSKTLYALLGIMVGALYGPIKIASSGLETTNIWFVSIVLLVIGLILVFLIEKFAGEKILKEIKKK